MAPTRKQSVSPEERAARRQADRERLEQAARQMLTSDGWQAWIRVRSANGLARYSVGNLMLIAMQTGGTATFVAGFRAWLDLDRCVMKGEKAIRILAPMPVKTGDVAKDAPDGADQEVRVLFKSVPVFDAAQVEVLPGRDPAPLSPPAQPIIGDSHAHLLVPLTRLAGELGYRVEIRPVDGPAGGWCDSRHRLIVIDGGLPANARVRVLVHELAHALDLGYEDLGRDRAEVLVDCVTYVVCAGAGLDVSGESIPYVAGWGEDGALEAIQAYAQTIDEVARRIQDAINPAKQDQAQAA